jgi:Cytochrome P450
LQERRADPRDDLFTTLITAEIQREDGEKSGLDDIEIACFATLLGGAGAETVTKLVSTAVAVFARNPEQWHKLLEDRGKIPAAVEELLRYEGPVQYNVRRSLKQVHLHGVTIPAGKPVFLLGGSANRDPAAWTDPDVFDIDRDRTEAQNIGLGYGIHSCQPRSLPGQRHHRRAAICVGFVHHCFYEVFDQLGPQLRWWAWNTDNPLNHPMLQRQVVSEPVGVLDRPGAFGPGFRPGDESLVFGEGRLDTE